MYPPGRLKKIITSGGGIKALATRGTNSIDRRRWRTWKAASRDITSE
jgi:hypothetical protein